MDQTNSDYFSTIHLSIAPNHSFKKNKVTIFAEYDSCLWGNCLTYDTTTVSIEFDSSKNIISKLEFRYNSQYFDQMSGGVTNLRLLNLKLLPDSNGKFIARMTDQDINSENFYYSFGETSDGPGEHKEHSITVIDTVGASAGVITINGHFPLKVNRAPTNSYCSIFPNPTNGIVSINNTGKYSEVKIYTDRGVFLEGQQLAYGMNKVQLILPTGIYFVQIGNCLEKIIIQR